MTQRQPKLDRRRAIKAIGLGLGGAVALGSTSVQAVPRDSETLSSSADTRYRASEHVLTYYATLSEQEG